MMNLESVKLKAKNFRCFGNIPQGFENMGKINVIIGKNNAGKSALLDLVQYAISPAPINGYGHKGEAPVVTITRPAEEADIRRAFNESHSGGYINGNHLTYGSKFINLPMTAELKENGEVYLLEQENPDFMADMVGSARVDKLRDISREFANPFRNRVFRKISAERNILKENFSRVTETEPQLDQYGNGATNLIANFINVNSLPEEVVEVHLLKALKEIYGNDADFSRITTQMNSLNQEYEVYFEETKKGKRISLSDSGSSLKTVLLVLLNVIVIPRLQNIGLEKYVFAFEELENNLHPSLQRRLLSYLKNVALQYDCTFIFTTHSNIIIDMFAHQDSAKMFHIKHNGENATVSEIVTFTERHGVLDDLDFRASDVLQANGIIWVEGPSDRIYLKKWIELWSYGTLQEDIHYQFVFYGGSIRKHLSAKDPEEVDGAISVFRINRNSIITMDSDKGKKSDKMDQSKLRLLDEFDSLTTSYAFATAGRDIENYITPTAIKKYLKLSSLPRNVEQFEQFSDYLNEIKPGSGKTFENNKVLFAEKIKEHFDKDDFSASFDLSEVILRIIGHIRAWNKIV